MKLFSHSTSKTKAKPIKLNIINAIELKRDANYILVADSRHFKPEELNAIMRDVRRAGVKNVVSFMLQGGPDNAIQLIDRPKRNGKKT